MLNHDNSEALVLHFQLRKNGVTLAHLEATQVEAYAILDFFNRFSDAVYTLSHFHAVQASQSPHRIERHLFECIQSIEQVFSTQIVEQREWYKP